MGRLCSVHCKLQCYQQFFSFQYLYVTNTKDTARQIWKTEPGEICSVLAGGQLFRYWRDLLSPDRELRWYLRVRFPTQSTQDFKEGDDRRKYCWELRWSNWYPSHCSSCQSMFLSEKILLKENFFSFCIKTRNLYLTWYPTGCQHNAEHCRADQVSTTHLFQLICNWPFGSATVPFCHWNWILI